jgi:hypothetical protein
MEPIFTGEMTSAIKKLLEKIGIVTLETGSTASIQQ